MSAPPPGQGTPPPGGGGALRIRAATRADIPVLLEMFRELADYEHLLEQLRADEERLTRALFADPPAASALMAELDDEVVGYAVFFRTFSTFLAIQGVWLEDLFVRPAHRGAGVGKALLAAVAAHLREIGGERLEWAALDWNEPALGFYRRIGAQTMGEWVTHRLIGEELARLAAEAPDGAGAARR